MSIDLQRFCANAGDPRKYLQAPWQAGEYVYATNGHILLRVLAADYPGHVPADKHPDAPALFKKHLDDKAGEFEVFPARPKPPKCKACGGKGFVWAVECESCEGEGTFRHHGHDYDCKACEHEGCAAGPGWIDADEESGEKATCDKCRGLGHELDRHSGTSIAGTSFQAVYLWFMSELPGARCRIAPYPDASAFIGEGWQALVMPMRD